MATNFVSNDNVTVLMQGIADKFQTLSGAYRFRGSVTFANLPASLTRSMTGYVYNITNNFTTDARFIEGAGHKYNAGTNVAVADLSHFDEVTPAGSENPKTQGWYELVSGKYVPTADETVDSGKTYYELTVDVKFDVAGSFEDFTDIYNMVADTFNKAQDYAVDDIVIHEGGLYKFTAAYDHTVETDWNPSLVASTQVTDLIEAAEPDELTTAQVNALLALLDA